MAVYFQIFKYFFMLLVVQGVAFNSGMLYMKEENSSCRFMLIKSVLMVVLFLLSEVLLTTCHVGAEGGR